MGAYLKMLLRALETGEKAEKVAVSFKPADVGLTSG